MDSNNTSTTIDFDDTDGLSVNQLESMLKGYKYRNRFVKLLRSTIITVIVVAAVSVIVAMMFMPVLQINGSSMSPTFENNDLVIAFSRAKCDTGDIAAFYFNNSILVKRVIARSGQWVDIDEDGQVFVDGVLIDEPYLVEHAFGDCNIDLPYQVPDGRYFVMGDHRSTSIDSRNSVIGCIAEEMIVGRVAYRVWPLNSIGAIN